MKLCTTLDVLVIGAGQAGLAVGYHLRETALRHQLLDGNTRVGDSWRRRYDSLVLFSPRAYSALPGLSVPGDPVGCPTKDEIADYLERYARHFALPVVPSVAVTRLERRGTGFRAMTADGATVDARAVVLATGAFQQPAVPALASGFGPEVAQLTAESYHNPEQLPSGGVLVVGDGATGRQIARELAPTRRVYLATGRPRRAQPERLLRKHLFWWMEQLGLFSVSSESRLGQAMMRADPFPGRDLQLNRLRRDGVQIAPRLVHAEGRHADFTDGSSVEIDVVIWATGYREYTDWVTIPEVKDERGGLVHRRGISLIPGLYLIGRPWQWTRGSALLYGVGADAAYVTHHLTSFLYQGTVTEVEQPMSRLSPHRLNT